MKKIMFALLISLNVQAKVKIAVLDTGFDFNYFGQIPLCERGHIDFSGEGLQDKHGHGTNVAGLISQQLNEKDDYCILIYKIFGTKPNKESLTLADAVYNKAIEAAIEEKVDIINYSASGVYNTVEEKVVIKKALDAGIKIVAAAGNESKLLNQFNCKYFPACYDDRIITVGNGTGSSSSVPSSNYGAWVKYWEDGYRKEAFGYKMTGTSQAAAIKSGKLAKEILKGQGK